MFDKDGVFGRNRPTTNSGARAPNAPPRSPFDNTTKQVEPASSVVADPAPAKEPAKETMMADEAGSKLIVGPNIKLKGAEITDCDTLVVEGRVEAAMNSRVIQIFEGGTFTGKAEIDVAEIRGRFEGDLTARKRLVVYSTGRVSGKIRYGKMSIEDGGEIAGDVASLAARQQETAKILKPAEEAVRPPVAAQAS
jgi:cytoskeletal protein CcmA (bactofilin family)